MQEVVECFDGAFEFLAVHRQRRVEEQDDVAWLTCLRCCVAALIEDCSSLEIAAGVLRGERRIAQVVCRNSFRRAIGCE